jgi:hypothetical protein
MIKAPEKRLDLDSIVIFIIIWFYDNNYNHQSNYWIELKIYQEFYNILFHIKLNSFK